MNTIYGLPCRHHGLVLQQTDTNQENPLDIIGSDTLHAASASFTHARNNDDRRCTHKQYEKKK